MVPLPFNPIPKTSVKQFILFAVYMPEHEPQVGQALFSYSSNSSKVMVFAATEPTASKTEDRLVFLPAILPANMGPPLTKIVGMLILAAAINRPGTFLSQLGII